MNNSEIKPNSHFWAKVDGRLAVLMRTANGNFYICGPWEVEIRSDSFVFIWEIQRPESETRTLLYYC